MALYKHRTEHELREREAIATALACVGQELIASLDTSTILDRLCQLAIEALGLRLQPYTPVAATR